MTDLTDLLAQHFLYYDDDAAIYECLDPDGDSHARFGDPQGWREHFAEVATTNHLVTVELPQPVAPLDHWAPDCVGAWPVSPHEDPVSAFQRGEVFDPDGNRMSVERARALAAALLAAAAAAERAHP